MHYSTNKLAAIKRAARHFDDSLKHCDICPRKCGADRAGGKIGYCRAGEGPRVYSHSAHHGEEPALSGSKGSGTIFFSHCNMKCVYCQNYYFSQIDQGENVSVERLSEMMLELEKRGCHNINLVSPTHYLPQILRALEAAASAGLSLPIIYNTSGYELADTIRNLDGVVDIYMPDMRYSDNRMAQKYSDSPNYVEFNRQAVLEMHRQVGELVTDGEGVAKNGLIIRLLVMPGGISGTGETLRFIAEGVSRDSSLSIMSQYYPTYKAYDFTELSRLISVGEYNKVVDAVKLLGLNKGWIQEEPKEMDARFLGTNIQPRKEVK